ncbi:MAG TPA: cation transporter [Anaerolineae bacterium]|nr:cation transporter [Anaerolineae bacterium]
MSKENLHKHKEISNLRLVFFLNLLFALAEIIGGMWTNSVAILADALHDLGDSITLGLSWQLERIAQRKGDLRYSYGYQRYSLLGAVVSAIVLVVGSVFMVLATVPRLIHPEPSDARGMLLFALTGILVNGIAVLRLREGKTMHARVITWHLLEDVLGWLAVLIVSLFLLSADIQILDPILSLLITAYVLFNVFRNLKKTLALFLQAVPDEVEIKHIEQELLQTPKVKGIHHTHIWSLDGQHHVLTTHIVLNENAKKEDIRNIKSVIRDLTQRCGLEHTTVEFEYLEGDCSMSKKGRDM